MNAKALIASLDDLRRKLRAVNDRQVQSAALRGEMGALATEYFSSFKPAVVSAGASVDDVAVVDGIFRTLNELSHRKPSKAKCVALCNDAKKALIKLEGAGLARAPAAGAKISQSDELIVSSLRDVCPSAAAAYEQAMRDLQGGDRLSWRGPATDSLVPNRLSVVTRSSKK